jgi:hypothetical protein
MASPRSNKSRATTNPTSPTRRQQAKPGDSSEASLSAEQFESLVDAALKVDPKGLSGKHAKETPKKKSPGARRN